eukprot:10341807-Ditylum_brightwellii.AAC.1
MRVENTTAQQNRNMSMEDYTDSHKLGLIESSLDAIFQINNSGTILLVNKAAVEQFGWNRDELIGQNISMI